MISSLKESTINGMIWTALERFGTQAIQFITGIIIARLLSPSDYGVVGLLSIFMAISSTLIDSGLGSALIQNKNRSNIDYSTAFYFNAVVGITLYLMLFLIAPQIASFYNIPILCKITRIYTIILLLNSLVVVPITKLTIELNFKAQSIITTIVQIISGTVGIILAYNNYGVMTLVYQAILARFLSLILIFCYTKWFPLLIFSFSSFKQLFAYGSKLLCSSLINTVYNNINSLIIGKRYSVDEVGFYNRGYNFPYIISNSFQGIILKVAFPIMSDVQDDKVLLRKAYEKFLKMPVFLLVPSLSLLIISAPSVIEFLLGDKWLPCVPYIRLISFAAMLEPLTHINLNILYVKGRTDLVLKLELIKKPIAFLIIIISLQFGVLWLCFGQALYSIIAYAFNCYFTKKYIDLNFFSQLKLLYPTFINSITAGGITFLSTLYIDDCIVQLIISVIIFFISYIGICTIKKDDCLIEYYLILKRILHK